MLGAHELRAPNPGRREVVVTERRRKQEFALAMRRLAEELYPPAEKKIRVVLDNLSTHTAAAAFYEGFSAEVARKNWPEGSSFATRRCTARG